MPMTKREWAHQADWTNAQCRASIESMNRALENRESIDLIDAQLAQQSRAESALRLHLGQVLEVLARGPCFELGFSSLTAYALERCERSVRWALAARALAQRLEALPELRRAVAEGSVSWSKAELVAPVVAPVAAVGEGARWIEAAKGLTVRELRALVAKNASSEAEASLEDDDEPCTLECTVDREEAWLFEATRSLLDQLGTRGTEAQVEALLAEAQSTLIEALPAGTIELEAESPIARARAEWWAQLARWRTEAEACCEPNFRSSFYGMKEEVGRASTTSHSAAPRGSAVSNGCDPSHTVTAAATRGCTALRHHTARELDQLAQSLSRALAMHELTLARLILDFHRADGWRHLGYATETQYARERLGISRSSYMARRALAVQLESLPHIAEALGKRKHRRRSGVTARARRNAQHRSRVGAARAAPHHQAPERRSRRRARGPPHFR